MVQTGFLKDTPYVQNYTVKMVSWGKTLHVKPVLRRVYIYTQSHVYKQDVFKCHVFLQDTNSQVMFLYKTLWFSKACPLKPFLRHMSGLKTCLCVLDCVCSGSIFFYFYCFRHVYCKDMSYI